MKTFAQTCSTSTYFKAVTSSENTTKYNAWIAASGENPDQTINFENFTNGETLNNIHLRLGLFLTMILEVHHPLKLGGQGLMIIPMMEMISESHLPRLQVMLVFTLLT
jgi:hypothetical protein